MSVTLPEVLSHHPRLILLELRLEGTDNAMADNVLSLYRSPTVHVSYDHILFWNSAIKAFYITLVSFKMFSSNPHLRILSRKCAILLQTTIKFGAKMKARI